MNQGEPLPEAKFTKEEAAAFRAHLDRELAQRKSGNGQPVIQIGRKGKKLFTLGDRPPCELDVVLVQNQWLDVDRQFRDEKGEVPRERWGEYGQALWAFASHVLGDESLTHAEALEFKKLVDDEVNALRPFFEPATSASPSSPGNSTLRFSP